MSIDNSELLLLLGGEKEEDPIVTKQTIGVAGKRGFGVGIYGGTDKELNANYLYPMEGYNDSRSENYGNYQESITGSVMVFIPAFCYRIGNPNAPSYARDGVDAIEIRDALELGMPVGTDQVYWVPPDGFILHRAFIDSGSLQRGFFIDKYLCSPHPKKSMARSAKGQNPLSLSPNGESTSGLGDTLPGSGKIDDAISLAMERGSIYSCMTAFQWSALSMLSLAHGQATTSAKDCAWYDSTYKYNFPKGCNSSLKDIDDKSVTYTENTKLKGRGQTGSGTPFAKTTHNGQACGVADVNGVMYQVATGVYRGLTSEVVLVALEEEDARNFTLSYDESQTEEVSGFYNFSGYWGSTSSASCFPKDTYGPNKALCGVFPLEDAVDGSNAKLFGFDTVNWYLSNDSVLLVGGFSRGSTNSGIWCRYCRDNYNDSDENVGFRAGAYIN